MDANTVLMTERINEVLMMCARDNPSFEQISNFSVALYVIGCSDAHDIMCMHDFDICDAVEVLKKNFKEINESDIPQGYTINEHSEKYLLVLGDPLFPTHFAVVVDMNSKKPYFSKLRYFGSGYDNLQELLNEFLDEGLKSRDDAHYFKLA